MRDPEPVELFGPELHPLIGELRVRAWGTVLRVPADLVCWLDDYDRTARHWAFLVDGAPVAAARMTVHDTVESLPDTVVYCGIFDPPPATPIAETKPKKAVCVSITPCNAG